jgi:Putative MetA-pathway of phenol degradation
MFIALHRSEIFAVLRLGLHRPDMQIDFKTTSHSVLRLSPQFFSALIVFTLTWASHAQFTDPRNYQNAPIGVNQAELAYAYARSDTSIDPSIVIGHARLNLNQGTISYTRYFGLLRRMAWFSPSLPIAGLNGSISGTSVSAAVTGTGDSGYEMALLLMGGPALTIPEFKNYQPTTTIGVSLNVTAPTGQYNADKLLNLGSNRWSFTPEFAVSWPFGPQQKWALDAYTNIAFYTDNTSYRGREILKQEPLPGFEGHISYAFLDNLVASLDARYSGFGRTTINNVNQNDSQKNFVLGSEVILSLNERNSLSFVVARALVHENGPTITGVIVKYDYYWGKGFK